jgi:hypothetical protein
VEGLPEGDRVVVGRAEADDVTVGDRVVVGLAEAVLDRELEPDAETVADCDAAERVAVTEGDVRAEDDVVIEGDADGVSDTDPEADNEAAAVGVIEMLAEEDTEALGLCVELTEALAEGVAGTHAADGSAFSTGPAAA